MKLLAILIGRCCARSCGIGQPALRVDALSAASGSAVEGTTFPVEGIERQTLLTRRAQFAVVRDPLRCGSHGRLGLDSESREQRQHWQADVVVGRSRESTAPLSLVTPSSAPARVPTLGSLHDPWQPKHAALGDATLHRQPQTPIGRVAAIATPSGGRAQAGPGRMMNELDDRVGRR